MHATLQDYIAFLEKVADETGIEAFRSDPSGLVGLNIEGEYDLHLQFVQTTSKILCFTQVLELPPTADKEIYRTLLAAGLFGRDTAGGTFALETDNEAIIYSYLLDFDPEILTVEAFIRTLEQILALVDLWSQGLQKMLADPTHAKAPSVFP